METVKSADLTSRPLPIIVSIYTNTGVKIWFLASALQHVDEDETTAMQFAGVAMLDRVQAGLLADRPVDLPSPVFIEDNGRVMTVTNVQIDPAIVTIINVEAHNAPH